MASLPLADFNRIKKFMNTTESGADPEVLTAIKKVNGLLAKNGVTWDMVFKRMVTLEVEGTVAAPATHNGAPTQKQNDDASINQLFERALANVKPGSFRDLILDIQSKWERFGNLSERQLATVRKAASNEGRR